MKKVDILKSYIEKIDNAPVYNKEQIKNLIEDISRICFTSDELDELVLDCYSSGDYVMEMECAERNIPYERNIAYKSDLRKLKAKLEMEIAVLEDCEEKQLRLEQTQKEERELEKLRLQVQIAQSGIKIENINNATSNSNSNAEATSKVTITIIQAIENISNIPEAILSLEEKSDLEDKLSSVDVSVKTGDKNKTWNKVGNVLKYIADKGVEVGIATLPYLEQITKMLGN